MYILAHPYRFLVLKWHNVVDGTLGFGRKERLLELETPQTEWQKDKKERQKQKRQKEKDKKIKNTKERDTWILLGKICTLAMFLFACSCLCWMGATNVTLTAPRIVLLMQLSNDNCSRKVFIWQKLNRHFLWKISYIVQKYCAHLVICALCDPEMTVKVWKNIYSYTDDVSVLLKKTCFRRCSEVKHRIVSPSSNNKQNFW